MKALLYIEMKDGAPAGASLELIRAAEAIGAKTDLISVNTGEGILEEDAVTAAVADRARSTGADIVLLAATTLGKLAAPRIAARLNAGSVNDAIRIEVTGGKIAALRPVYSGTIQEKILIDTASAVISVRGGSYEAPEEVPEITAVDAELPEGRVFAKIREAIEEAGETAKLEDAKIIVTGGRGMGTVEDFALCAQLAEVLGGVVGATRPAIENGWINRTHQVGQSGKIVAPDLYIACGVSGATQHVSGMSGSKYIISINKDEDAPIFAVSDIGIVGDAKQILPLMIEELRKRK